MDRLPPELVGLILSYTVPPSSFENFTERSAMLRAFSRISRTFREEAQHLLYHSPVLALPSKLSRSDQILQLRSALEKNKGRVFDLRMSWTSSGSPLSPTTFADQAAASLLQHKAVFGLRSLSLNGMRFNPNFFYLLKNLTDLSLEGVSFPTQSFDITTPLPQLLHLSTTNQDTLPPCLLLPQLPNLTALARHGSGVYQKVSRQYLLAGPWIPLQMISLDYNAFKTYTLEQVVQLAECTLVDIGFQLLALFPGVYNSGQGSLSLARHIRFGNDEKGKNHLYLEKWNTAWQTTLPKVFTNLQTVVVPAHWRSFGIRWWSVMEDFARQNKVKILVEDEWELQGEGESKLSKTFMRYRGII